MLLGNSHLMNRLCEYDLIDLCKQPLDEGISIQLRQAIAEQLQQIQQTSH